MSTEHLLKKLGRVARETDPAADPRFRRLTTGTLSAAEERELVEHAQRSERGAAALEAYRPLDEAFREKLTGDLAKRFAPRRPWRLYAGAAAAAAAFAGVMLARQPAPAIPMASYVVEIHGGELRTRSPGDRPAVPTIGPGSRLEILLLPEKDVTERVDVHAFLVQGDDVRAWSPPVVVAEHGEIRMEGERGTLFRGVPAGAWEMVFAVGRPGALPATAADLKPLMKMADPASNGVRLLHGDVVLRDGG